MGSGKGGSVLIHVGTNNVEREGTTAIEDAGRAGNTIRDFTSNRKEWS